MTPSAPTTGALPDNRLLFRFLLVAVALYLAWFFGYQQWLGPDGRLDAVLCAQITRASVGLLQALGFDAAVGPTYDQLVLMNGQPSVIVYPPCNGLVLYALFAGFVLAFPGPWRRKAWFVPVGVAVIWGLNVLRVAALALNHHYSHQTVEFNHHYTFNFVVYGCIFGLWMLWARRLAVAPSTSRARA
ncbi:exosortase X [Hymenobacter ruricola]|uniref:Archaeosortase/exosortase family protein n=1 Tax=Hymenobacter ruricola TaxID=2791023 RepID=A0ABS0I4J8_9BACT|nr:archaeosortase/exosortase family protein [Hymenobacter ruricola]MBF9221898.1 archaeosortase/exosortase family protein [Hymenobacter ruricola]